MSTMTVTGRTGAGLRGRRAGWMAVNVPMALSACRAVADRTVSRHAGTIEGAVLATGHSALRTLLPYLSDADVWSLVDDEDAAAVVRRSGPVAPVVVLDGRGGPGATTRRGEADFVVVDVGDLGTARLSRGPGRLLDVSGLSGWRWGSWMRGAQVCVGWHLWVDTDRERTGQVVHLIGRALRAWVAVGQARRPLLMLRTSDTPSAHALVAQLARVCRLERLPVPLVRVDVTPTVLQMATTTAIRVLAIQGAGGHRVVMVDALPPQTMCPIRVRGCDTAVDPLAPALLHHHDQVRTVRLRGRLRPGCELIAPSCEGATMVSARLRHRFGCDCAQ